MKDMRDRAAPSGRAQLESALRPVPPPNDHGMLQGLRTAEIEAIVEPLFDAQWYLESNPDVAAAGERPLAHYVRVGAAEGRSPHPLFDVPWFLARVPEAVEEGENPVVRLLDGGGGWRNPNPLFDAGWYASTYAGLIAPGHHPLLDYIGGGAAEGRRPHPLFDPTWYLETYPDVAAAEVEPLAHFLNAGSSEGRNPSPLFDTEWYRAAYLGGDRGTEPLTHYLGHDDSHDPNPLFDTRWYLDTYPEAAGTNPLAHYVQHHRDGHDPNRLFDARWYLRTYPEVATAGVEPLEHFLHAGARIGWQGSPRFDPHFYGAQVGLDTDDQVALYAHRLRDPFRQRGPLGRLLSTVMEADPAVVETALGSGLEFAPGTRVAVGILDDEAGAGEKAERSAQVALARCGPNVAGTVARIPAGMGSAAGPDGFGARHNRACAAAFEAGAQVYIGADGRGAFHPVAIGALLKMNAARQGAALLAAVRFPDEGPGFHHPETLDAFWACGACFLLPAAVWRATGGFDDEFGAACADMDLSARARGGGFGVAVCQAALFHIGASRGQASAADRPALLRDTLRLGGTWGWDALSAEAERRIATDGLARPAAPCQQRGAPRRVDDRPAHGGLGGRLSEALAWTGLGP